MRKCEEADCLNSMAVRGYCLKHYQAHRGAGDFGGNICHAPECSRTATAIGLCHAHYQQLDRGGELKPIREVGEWGAWYLRKEGDWARRRTLNGKRETQRRSRYSMEQKLGRELLRTERVIHLDGDIANDDPDNLVLR